MINERMATLIVEAVISDVRLSTLPLAAQGLWLYLAKAAAEGLALIDDPAWLAGLLHFDVDEAEQHLPTLIAEGLIVREGSALRVPLVDEASAG